jgi:hypothetical protein
MTDELMLALDDCLNALGAGATLDEALARHPALADDLRPMLEAARAAGASAPAAEVPRARQTASRAQFLARAAELRQQRAPLRLWLAAPRALAAALTVFFALVLGAYGVAAASAQSLPGDPLYGVKRTVERAQLVLTFDARARAQLEGQFAEQRVEEARALTALGREAEIEFRGAIELIESDRWIVAGITVRITEQTRASGSPALGAIVEVTGLSQADGTVLAARIDVSDESPAGPEAAPSAAPTATPAPAETPAPTQIAPGADTPAPSASPGPTEDEGVEVEFTGVVESINAETWRIGGQTVRVTAATELRGGPQIGLTVEVKAVRFADGSLVARRIEVKASPGGPSATNTPEPSETLAAPTATRTPGSGGGSGPSPSNTPKPSPTPQPASTPDSGGGSGPSPSNTPEAEEVEFEGVLQSINGNVWTVGGQAVIVTGETEIRDNPQVGDQVRVKAERQPDGSLIAQRIEKR